jgi:hypothetical protein
VGGKYKQFFEGEIYQLYRAILISIGILFIWAIVDVVIFTTLQLPMDTSIAISLIPLLLTSIWAGFDARKIEFKKYKTSLGSTIYGGGGVFAAVLVFWIVFFPWYLFSRDKILSGRAKLKDGYEDEALKGGEMMEENKDYQSMAREDAITVMQSRRKKSNSGWWALGVITVGLIFFFLFFRILIIPDDFTVVAKKHPTFSNTFINLDDFIKRSNEALEEYNKPIEKYNKAVEKYNKALEKYKSKYSKILVVPPERMDEYWKDKEECEKAIEEFDEAEAEYNNVKSTRDSFETHLRHNAVDPALYEELYEKGLIGPKKEDDNPK